MGFADTFVARITQGTIDFAAKAGTPEARIQALTWAILQSTSAFTIATGSNPNTSLLDMIVLVTLGRMAHEDYWIPKVWGEADRPMFEAFTQMEARIWDLAGRVLTKAQQDEVRAALAQWHEQTPDMGISAFVKLPIFEDILGAIAAAKPKSGGLGELLSVDPLSDLDPAVREVEQTRLFAERTTYYLQRMPLLLSAQVELLSLKFMRMPEVQSALTDSERISLAAESLAQTAASLGKTAATLPELVHVEREAALKQISDELTLQRQGLIADLDKAEAPTHKILTDARGTLEAGAQMSTALDGALKSLDTFMGRFDAPPAAAGAPPPPAEPGKPFDITEYGETATRLTATLHEVNTLVQTLDHDLPQVQNMLSDAEQRGTQTIDYAFKRGLQLAGVIIATIALAVLGVRWISARLARSVSGHSKPSN